MFKNGLAKIQKKMDRQTVETFHETSLQKTKKATVTVAFFCGGIES